MNRMVIASMVALATATAALAQGFESMDMSYTTSTTPVTTSSSSSDEKFSIYADLGIGFSLGGELVSVPIGVPQPGLISIDGSSDKFVDGTLQETKDEYLNFGGGLKVDLGATYRILEYVDVIGGLDLSFRVPYAETVDEDINTVANTTATSTLTIKDTQVGLKVLLAPRFTIFDLLDVRVGAGLGIYWTGASFEYELKQTGQGTQTVKGDIDCKASVPFIGMIGLEYPAAKRVVVYLDAVYQAMNVTLQKIKVEESSVTPTPPPVEYQKDDLNDPAPAKIPASNIAIRLGVRIPLF